MLGFVVFVVVGAIGVTADEKHYIESPKVTDWGSWGELESCPEGRYVVGMQLKVEKSDGWKDDTGLNGIRFFCSELGERVSGEVNAQTPTITSSVGHYGNWKNVFLCGDSAALNSKTSGVVGFQLQSEQSKGRLDDTSANNLRMVCADLGGGEVHEETVEGDGTPWGEWTSVQMCRRGYAVCGLRTQVEEARGKDDDTSLNNLKAECCKVKMVNKEVEEEGVVEDRRTQNPMEFARNYKEAIANPRAEERKTVAPTTTVTTTSPSTTTYTTTPPTQSTVIISSTAVTTTAVNPAQNQKDDESRLREKLSEELKNLAELDFGATQTTYTVKIPVDGSSVSVDDIQEANPIVPPEVIQSVAQATDADHTDHKDPDPAKVKYISGSIIVETSTTPETVTDKPVVNQKLASGSGSFFLCLETMILMHLIALMFS